MSNRIVLFSSLLLFPASAFSQTTDKPADASAASVPLTVERGVPLRLYLTKRLSKRSGEPVHAKLLEPVYAFDREVIPAGTEVTGSVSSLRPVSKMNRASALLGGDFTPLHRAEVEFTSAVLPGGRTIPLHAAPSLGLNTIYTPEQPKKSKRASKKANNPAPNTGVLGIGKQQVRMEIERQINGRTRGVADLVRGPDKVERLQEFLIAKLPYHPQWIRKGTRFDAELLEPLTFGTAQFAAADLSGVGSQPPADAVVHARLISALDSATANPGDAVEAILSQPLFSQGKLILPEGSHITGHVTLAQPAKWLHRGGQLRFSFQDITLPPGLTLLRHDREAGAPLATRATLAGAEGSGLTPIKVDPEGGVQAVEPKTRFIAPALSVLIAAKSLDNDEGKAEAEGNTGGRTLGGLSGLGVVGAIAAQSSKALGSALGIYGMGMSVYTNILSKGGEVEFNKNSAVDIRFGSRQRPPGMHALPQASAASGY